MSYDKEKMNEVFNGKFRIPEYMHDGLDLWIRKGIEPGGFLSAVLKNDLSAAMGRADEENMANLPAYIFFLYNYAPCGCWGSKTNFEDWKNNKGLS